MADENSKLPASKKEAKQLGFTRFFTGVPCAKGHIDQRLTNNGVCIVCHRATVRRYKARITPTHEGGFDDPRLANLVVETKPFKRVQKAPEVIYRIAAISAKKVKYFTGAPCVNGHLSERRTDDGCCCECRKIQNARAYKRNKEKFLSRNKKWKVKYPDRYEKSRKKYYTNNRAIYTANTTARRLGKRCAMPPWADKEAIREIYKECKRISEETGIKHHVDHIVPLRGRNVCGLHVPANLIIIPATENQKKFNSFYDWENMRIVARRRSKDYLDSIS